MTRKARTHTDSFPAIVRKVDTSEPHPAVGGVAFPIAPTPASRKQPEYLAWLASETIDRSERCQSPWCLEHAHQLHHAPWGIDKDDAMCAAICTACHQDVHSSPRKLPPGYTAQQVDAAHQAAAAGNWRRWERRNG